MLYQWCQFQGLPFSVQNLHFPFLPFYFQILISIYFPKSQPHFEGTCGALSNTPEKICKWQRKSIKRTILSTSNACTSNNNSFIICNSSNKFIQYPFIAIFFSREKDNFYCLWFLLSEAFICMFHWNISNVENSLSLFFYYPVPDFFKN